MQFYASNVSCGVQEAFSLYVGGRDPQTGAPTSVEHEFSRYVKQCKAAFVIFSDKSFPKGQLPSPGQELARIIRERIASHEVGALFETDVRRNPNSGNSIQIWIFGIDPIKVHNWPPVPLIEPTGGRR